MKNLNILEKEDIKIAVLKMAMPMILAQAVSMIYNLVDRYFVSNYVSTEAFASIGVGFPLFLICISLLNFFIVGTPITYGRALGEKNYEKASDIKNKTILFSFLFITASSLVLIYFLKPILKALGGTPSTLGYSFDYYSWILGGLGVMYLNIVLSGFIRSEGSVNYSMMVVMIGAVLNIGFDYILIVNFHMGTAGAAIATVISQCVGVLLAVLHQVRSKLVKLDFRKMFAFRIDLVLAGATLSMASVFTPLINSLFNFVMNNVLVIFSKGDTAMLDMYMVAWSLVISIRGLVIQPLIGLGSAAGPLISFNYGAKNKDRVVGSFVWTIIYGYVIVMPFWYFFTIGNDAFITLFNIKPEMIALCKKAMMVSFILLPLTNIPMLFAPNIQFLGRVKLATTLTVVPITITGLIAYPYAYFFGLERIWDTQFILGIVNLVVLLVVLRFVFSGKKFVAHFSDTV